MPHTLQTLPVEIHRRIATFIRSSPWSVPEIRATNRFFRALVPPLSLEELLGLEAASPFAHYRHLYACRHCLRLRKADMFAAKMLRGKRGPEWHKDGGDTDGRGERWCLECGFALAAARTAPEDAMVDVGQRADVSGPSRGAQRRYTLGTDVLGYDQARYVWCLYCWLVKREVHDPDNTDLQDYAQWKVEACLGCCRDCCEKGRCAPRRRPQRGCGDVALVKERMRLKEERREAWLLRQAQLGVLMDDGGGVTGRESGSLLGNDRDEDMKMDGVEDVQEPGVGEVWDGGGKEQEDGKVWTSPDLVSFFRKDEEAATNQSGEIFPWEFNVGSKVSHKGEHLWECKPQNTDDEGDLDVDMLDAEMGGMALAVEVEDEKDRGEKEEEDSTPKIELAGQGNDDTRSGLRKDEIPSTKPRKRKSEHAEELQACRQVRRRF
ncbi:hypothetical protein K458DRAFT_413594 [Lentithecium fluviatile CBS 122367]|uniref:F-box domain-containing protein n=1 Tax=Lentithecium fluviatile CBS 122367 TaxID=1168545 RepID=A0A6G1JFG0_9PLEO|nr:hypothetical protein K458DRAFT_413594 [Lentithecium fluviatile CBS 122367]